MLEQRSMETLYGRIEPGLVGKARSELRINLPSTVVEQAIDMTKVRNCEHSGKSL